MFIRGNPSSHFCNFLILTFSPKFTWGIALTTLLRICPSYLLEGVGGVHLEQLYKTIFWFLRSSWARSSKKYISKLKRVQSSYFCVFILYMKKKLLHDKWFLEKMYFFDIFHIFSHFLTFHNFFNFQSINSMAFQCNRYSMKAKCLITCLSIYYSKNNIFAFHPTLLPKNDWKSKYLCRSFHLLEKMQKISNWWHFLEGFWYFFVNKQAL